MKKILVTILLVLLFVTAPLFAVTDSFNVTTEVADVGKIKVTTATVGVAPHTETAFDNLVAFGDLSISSSGAQTFTAYMSTISNSRSGYEVMMEATSMISTVSSVDSYIDYTVTVNGTDLTTTGSTAATGVKVLDVASLTGIAAESHAISLSIDSTTYAAAVAGSYLGTVTFTYTAT
ncbi:MAG TPA: hypothetical protein VJ869_03835 [Sphaerochaeta sp.]|nr:hypothetical protein [Sphaerochaeta sp.]